MLGMSRETVPCVVARLTANPSELVRRGPSLESLLGGVASNLYIEESSLTGSANLANPVDFCSTCDEIGRP